MSSFKSLEMAATVSAHPHIKVKKSFFGTKVIYEPTQSSVKAIIQEYTIEEGKKVERLLQMPLDKMADEIAQKGKPAYANIGHFRLELCLSDDHQFCALQLFRYADFHYNPVMEPLFFEGKDVETLALLV